MAVRRAGSISRGRGPKRETSWLDVEPVIDAANGGIAVITHVMTAAELAKRPFTIVRSHLTCFLESDQAIAAEFYAAAIGICIVSSQAAAIGVTAVPTPLTDQASDLWLLHQNMAGAFGFFTAAGFNELNGSAHQYDIDSKAARKINDDQEAVIVMEASGVGEGVTLYTSGRILIKEH